MSKIPFSPPKIYQQIIDEVVDTLKSGWITTGPKTKLFEKKLAAYCGASDVLCLNSATAGLETALRWFGVGAGDEVIIPAYTYCATANVVLHCGAIPVMVDVASDFNISIKKVEQAITSRTKVIIPVDFGGYPCDYEQLNILLQKKENLFKANNEVQKKLSRILLLSDSAHSFGASYKGKKIGNPDFSDITVFSFHAVKNLTTAEGGAMALNLPQPFNNKNIYKELCAKILHGQTKDALSKSNAGSWKYDVIVAGYKCNMTDLQASLGLVELDYYETQTLKRRREIVLAYDAFFKQKLWAITPVFLSDEKETSYHLYPLRITSINEGQRDEIIKQIAQQQVAVNVHFQPLPMLTAYKKLGYAISDFPVAYDNYQREISLPVYYDLTDKMLVEVCRVVEEAVSTVRC